MGRKKSEPTEIVRIRKKTHKKVSMHVSKEKTLTITDFLTDAAEEKLTQLRKR